MRQAEAGLKELIHEAEVYEHNRSGSTSGFRAND